MQTINNDANLSTEINKNDDIEYYNHFMSEIKRVKNITSIEQIKEELFALETYFDNLICNRYVDYYTLVSNMDNDDKCNSYINSIKYKSLIDKCNTLIKNIHAMNYHGTYKHGIKVFTENMLPKSKALLNEITKIKTLSKILSDNLEEQNPKNASTENTKVPQPSAPPPSSSSEKK